LFFQGDALYRPFSLQTFRLCYRRIIYLQSCAMKLFVGLGNPGENHSKNRHNIGFMVVDTIVNRYGGTPWKKKFQGLASEVILKQEKLIFLKPSTFMNLSGQSVSDACRFFKLSSTEICVFHDELDLPFLKIRTKIGGGHAGHNGLRSIQQHLGSDYFRVRLGIGHPGDRAKVASYVLNNFPKSSEADLSSWLEAVAEGFPQLKEANQEKFLNIVNGQSNTAKKTSDGKVPRTKLAPSNEPLNISKETKKSALERLLEKFR